MRALLAVAAFLAFATVAQAQQAIATAEAVDLFRTYCLKPLGSHARTNAAMAKAGGFSVTDTSGTGGVSERIVVRNGRMAVEMSNLRYGNESTCFVGFTPAEPRPESQAQAAALVAGLLNVPADAVQRKGKELRIKTKAGLFKIVVNRVYPISIGVTSAYR